MDLDGDIGDNSSSSVDEEVPSCNTSCSSSLMSIADSESEYSYSIDYDDDDTNGSESSSSSSESTVVKVCMLVWCELRYICCGVEFNHLFFDKGSEEMYDYLFQVQTTSQRTQKTDWSKVHI